MRTKLNVFAAFSAIEWESRLRPITALSTFSTNLLIIDPPLQAKMMAVWRSSVGSLLPKGFIMASTGN